MNDYGNKKWREKIPEVPNLLHRCWTSGNECSSCRHKAKVIRRLGFESKLTAWYEEVKTRVNPSLDNMKIVESCGPILGWTPKRGFAPDTNMWRGNQRTWTLKLQENTEKKSRSMSALSFSSWHVVLFRSANAVDSAFILSFFLPRTTLKVL